jgi:hypothetical protein
MMITSDYLLAADPQFPGWLMVLPLRQKGGMSPFSPPYR